MTPGPGPGPGDAPAPLPTAAAALLVAAGGAVGVLLRALLVTHQQAGGWPWVTSGINVGGSLLLGALLGVLQHGPDAGRRRVVRLVVGTGVLGGFTTYSTFAVEVHALTAAGGVAGPAYALVSLVLGVAAAGAGLVAAARLTARRAAGDDADPAVGAGGGDRDGAAR